MLNFFSTCYRGESGIKVNGIYHLPTTSSLEQLRRSEVWGVRLLKWRPLDQSTQLFCFPLLCRKSLQDIHNLFLDAKIIFLSKVMVENQRRIKINQAGQNRAHIFCTQNENLKPPAKPSCSFKVFCTLVASSRIRLSVKYKIRHITIKNTSTIIQ